MCPTAFADNYQHGTTEIFHRVCFFSPLSEAVYFFQGNYFHVFSSDDTQDSSNEDYRALLEERQALAAQLESFTEQMKQMKESGGTNQGVIPTDTKIRALLTTSAAGLVLTMPAMHTDQFGSGLVFNPTLFMLVMLPVIILESGLTLDHLYFGRNLVSVLTFATLGA